MASDELYLPKKNQFRKGTEYFVDQQINILDRGVDPKPMIMQFCKPLCHYWKAKLDRCEVKLRDVVKINPTKTCMYTMRDYVTCIQACVQPKIHNNVIGAELQ